MSELALRCPVCGEGLAPDALACERGPRAFRSHGEILDLRVAPESAPPPWPLEPGDLDPALRRLEQGASFKAALESLLLELSDGKAHRFMQVLREGRGAWITLLRVGRGRALFAGNALSGAVTPLARLGFEVTVLDASLERLRFGLHRAAEHARGRTRSIAGGDGPRLPFEDGAFDLVVRDHGGLEGGPEIDLAECRRVCRGELLITADNRLAYKRPHGPEDAYRVTGPARFARALFARDSGERTLRGWRKHVTGPGFAGARAYALYPHAKQFTNVVGIDGATPRLLLGPQERANRIKLAAQSLGLFPVFTPSFALIAPRTALSHGKLRIERILHELAQRTGEPEPAVEHLLGTRGNSSVIHTRVEGADPADERGRWTLHVPLCPKNEPQLALHFRALGEIRRRFPTVPVPEPLFHGAVDGVWLTCERRLAGHPAPQFCGDPARMARMLADAARHLAALVVRARAPLSKPEFEQEFGARIDLAARFAAVDTTLASLARLKSELREHLIGRRIPRVLYHADLRAKHVQVEDDGAVQGYLDWGTVEPAGLPYLDLLHLVVHERKQEAQIGAAEAWHIVRDREALREHERAALDAYCAAVGLDAETARALERFYPAAVAAMAEKNWDYSRPRWLHRQFGL